MIMSFEGASSDEGEKSDNVFTEERRRRRWQEDEVEEEEVVERRWRRPEATKGEEDAEETGVG